MTAEVIYTPFAPAKRRRTESKVHFVPALGAPVTMCGQKIENMESEPEDVTLEEARAVKSGCERCLRAMR